MTLGVRPDLAFSPEFRLVAACSWIAPDHLEAEKSAEVASICAGQLDWQHILYLVRVHGVQAVVFETLNRHATIVVPDAIMTVMKEWRKCLVIQSLHQSSELIRLQGTFSSKGVDVMPLKGQMLSQRLYGTLGMRTSSDLDILVRTADLDSACQLLEADGYCCSLHGTVLTSKQKAYIRNHLYHLEFYNQRNNITVELHWRLGSHWSPEHMALVWENIEKVSWLGAEVVCQNSILQLLFLCDHGARHRFFCIKWLSDVAKAFTALPDREWCNLLALAEALDLRATLAHSLLLVNWVYSVPLNQEVTAFVNGDKSVLKLSRKILRLLHLGSSAGVSHGRRLGGLFCSWQVLRLRSSLSLLRTLKPSLIAAADFHDYPLPDSFFWAYYLLRPFSWLRNYFK